MLPIVKDFELGTLLNKNLIQQGFGQLMLPIVKDFELGMLLNKNLIEHPI